MWIHKDPQAETIDLAETALLESNKPNKRKVLTALACSLAGCLFVWAAFAFLTSF